LESNVADILADYREWRQQQEARVSTHSAGCHMWHRDCMIHRLAAALAVEQAKRTPERPSTPGEGTRQVACTLTDAERERVSVVADWASEHLGQDDPGVVALRALMERLK
jgi:hypothetical protein